MNNFKAVKTGENKYHHKDHGDIFIHTSKKNSKYRYLWSSKNKYISNLFPIAENKYSIPNYQDSSYIVELDDNSLNVMVI